MKTTPFAIACGLLLLAQSGFAADRRALMDANAAVEANLNTPAGKRYEELMGTEFPQKFLPALKKCKESAGMSSGLDMFVKLAADGKVQQVLVYPENAFTTCTRGAVASGQLSRPPHGDYWMNVHLDGKH